MKRILIVLLSTLLLVGVIACQKQVTKESNENKETPSYVAYKFLEAWLQSDYKNEKKYLYDAESYELDSNAERMDIDFSIKNIKQIKEYKDKENKVIFVWLQYYNPITSSDTTEVYATRKNQNGDYKVDTNIDFDFESVKQQIEPKTVNPKSLGV
ncbi:hypothetical protein ACU5CE_33510 [Priestia megaterium]|uniref:hypothetical protein n=1 Tax=Priestia megaterium TaxID=1404 RepID=UPI00406BDC09